MKKTNEKGITLVSLVISVVVLLILASVTITITSFRNDGLVKISKETKTNTERQIALTDLEVSLLDVINGDGKTTAMYNVSDVNEVVTSMGGTFNSETNVITYNGYEFSVNLQTGDIN